MKILHLNDETWDSGITAYALQVAWHLKESGHEVVVGLRPEKTPEGLAVQMGLATRPISHIWDVYRLLRDEPFDVINVHTGRTHSWSVLARNFVMEKRACPIVRTRGDAQPLKVNPLTRFVYRSTSAVIAASQNVAQQYKGGFRISQDRLHTIYPAIETNSEPKTPPLKTVGILGRLDPIKGHTVFLEAAAHILKQDKNVQFYVAGKEASVTYEILKNHARSLDIINSVQFMGYVPSVQEFMSQCTIGVIASLGSEEVSRVCLEWMATERPLVGTLVGCLPELIEPQETGSLVIPGDSAALAESILALLQNPSLAGRWGRNAYDVIRRRFNPQILVNKTLEVYRGAIEARSKKRPR